MRKSPLVQKFEITETSIELVDDNITKQEFIQAALEYVKFVSASTFKIGDLLNRFRELFGSDVSADLIPKLAAKTRTKQKTFVNSMSISRNAFPHERSDRISPTHYEALQSLRDQRERGKLITDLIAELDGGRNIPVARWRRLIHSAKVRTGQKITRTGPRAKRKSQLQ